MISQQQGQKQQVKILPYQIFLLNFYFLNTLELEQKIKTELDENPFLEQSSEPEPLTDSSKDAVKDYQDYDEFMYEDIPDYKSDYQNYFGSADVPNVALKSYVNFKDEAKEQLHLLDISEDEKTKSEYIIDLLSNDGLMDKPLDEVADIMSFNYKTMINPEDVQHLLSIIQTLDPIGIGACSIQECLLIQLKAMNTKRPDVKCALKLIGEHYADITHRQFEKIQKALNIDEEELKIVLNLIGTLKFHPAAEGASHYDVKNTIIPDFIISRDGDKLNVDLCGNKSNSVSVNHSLYDQLASQINKKDKAAKQYVVGKLQSAQWFINAIKQREDTMLRIMHCLVEFQYDYFMEGDIRLLKPMVLRNIADLTGFDISTISRITSNKYAETHFGQLALKNLFSEGIVNKKGEMISNKVIQSIIEEAITQEDTKHSYTDGELANILSSRGYNIARRTVAKYREQMDIPIAQVRMFRS